MGWFGGGVSSKFSPTKLTDEPEPEAKFFEDLLPKFDDSVPPEQAQPPAAQQAILAQAFSQLKISDLSFTRLIEIPCFREATITGFQAMGVLGTITLFIYKNPSRLANWGACGFLLGSMVGWEQCRLIRRKKSQLIEKARKANREKLHKNLEESQGP